ncbi:hypothetical protein CLV30_102324 [Haloactinopolyspora alba]|uniref:Cytidine deaminase n=1 Tax=Haloactinopolyspora alba TaxID=648780 RepID=A0A2P8EBU5_9ACTN|nr:cytidine deaminase [Haloactinopolyspora alba]PSL06935.1 hypothetical protein CLV30_102324 [Haloactinopolyspora alba]
MSDQPGLDPEDSKIITLARSARARGSGVEGAAVRDADGRTYAGADVALTSLSLSALQVAVAMAASSGARGLEAAAVVTTAGVDDIDVAVVADLGGPGVPVHAAGADGALLATIRT